MATFKAKGKARPKATTGKAAAPPKRESWLRLPTDARSERRFEPSSNPPGMYGLMLTCAGAAGIGAGIFGQLLRKAGPHPYAPHMFALGMVVFAVGLFVARRSVPPLRVGDAGVAAERSGVIERLPWHDVDVVRLASGALTFSGFGKLLSIPLGAHSAAAARALAEARSRIPARVAHIKDELESAAGEGGERVELEPPQVAGQRCKASDRLIAFENDARLCGRCGQAYHREEVPKHCKSCDARLT